MTRRRRRAAAAGAALALVASAAGARAGSEGEADAQEEARRAGAEGEDAVASSGESPRAALGLSPSWLRRNDYGDRHRHAFAPEAVAFVYAPTPAPRVYARPGLRLGYVGLTPAESPASTRFRERDFAISGELGAVYDGFFVPAASAGAGLRLRRIALEVADPVTPDEAPIARSEVLPVAFAQAAVGVPLGGTGLVIEPYARYEVIGGDDRSRLRFGADLTLGL